MMSRVVVGGVLVLAAAGCGAVQPDALARPVAPIASSAAPSSAAPSPSVDTAALLARAKAAAIAAKGLSALGVSVAPKQDKAVAYDVTAACGKRVDADRLDVHAAHNRTWSAQGWWISNTAYAYGATAGKDVVAQVKAAVESCRTYTGNDGQYTLHDAVALPTYKGVDATYAFCQTTKRPDNTFVSCVAHVAKGTVVSSLWTVHGSSRADNASGIKQAAAVAADTLA
jgi:hypothetical protein